MVQATLLLMLSAVTAAPGDAVLVEFTSTNCPHCETMKPVVASLEREGVPVRRVNVDRERDLAVRYQVRSIPTYVVVTGGKEQARLVGAQSIETLRRTLEQATSPDLTRTRSDRPAAKPRAETTMGDIGKRSEAMASPQAAEAIQRAEAATVRLRIHDDAGFGVGTGTIIDAHGEEALVLTCGHLFRDSDGKGRVEVDVFYAGDVKTVPGKVLDYEAKDRDIALVVIQPGVPVQPVPILPAGERLQTGQSVFSYGCDRGDDPSRQDTRITGVDKYNQHIDASNVEIAGAPLDGRSGGGLFDAQGRLIAVCNAADYKGDVGIYTGPGSIHWQLDRVNMAHLYEAGRNAPAANVALAGGPDAAPPPTRFASLEQEDAPGTNAPQATDREVILIVREGGQDRVLTFDQPPAELNQIIDRHATRR